jgi:hypothetical protein
METPGSLVRGSNEADIRLTEWEIAAVSLGLRTLLITMTHDEALCGVAAAGLAKLARVAPSPASPPPMSVTSH